MPNGENVSKVILLIYSAHTNIYQLPGFSKWRVHSYKIRRSKH